MLTSYSYSSPLLEAGSIRLLHLRPVADKTAPIECDLLHYSLEESLGSSLQYEALSYVWGDSRKTRSILVDGYGFDVTENLHAALLSLRGRSIERIWIDAICINQMDQQERSHQVRSMAKIYGKAHRVIVWLGETADNSEQVFQEIRARKKWKDASDNETLRRAVVMMLERRWFRRIWILQEVAAARRILIVCGSEQTGGYSFCLGLKSLEVFLKARPDLLNLIRSVNHLIRQANFRPTSGITWSDMSFLTIRPLGELLDMFHAHEATERHDKIYALLGMSSDALNASDLLPDYKLPWKEVFDRLVKFLLGKDVLVKTWDDMELATIKSNGHVIGRVSSVLSSPGWSDTNKVEIVSKATYGSIQRWTWNLYTSAKPIRQGDMIYLPQGGLHPIIIRSCTDHFAIIMIAATPPEKILIKEQQNGWTSNIYSTWSNLLGTVTKSPMSLLLVWDWEKEDHFASRRNDIMGLTLAEEADDRPQVHLAHVMGLWQTAKVFSDLENVEEAERLLEEATERCRKYPFTLTIMANLVSAYINQGLWEQAEELGIQLIETRTKLLGKKHSSTLISISKLALTYRNQGRWKEAKELEVRVMETYIRALGDEHPDTLTSMGNLALTYIHQGQWKKAEELEVRVMETFKTKLRDYHPSTLSSMAILALTYWNLGRLKEAEALEVEVMETRKVKLGDSHPSTLTSIANLASTYWNQKRLEEAEALDMQVAQTFLRVLGEKHPSTLTSMANLAATYWSLGRLEEAEALEVRVMKMRKIQLGQDHPATLTSMHNLGFTWKSQGHDEDAIDLMRQCVQLRHHRLGVEHPSSINSSLLLTQWESEQAANSALLSSNSEMELVPIGSTSPVIATSQQ